MAAGDGRDDHGQHRDDVNQADRFASLEEDRLRFGADIAAVHRSASDDVAEEGDGRGDDDVLESRGDDAPDVGVLRDRADDRRVTDGREVVAEDRTGEDRAEQQDGIRAEQDAGGEEQSDEGDGRAVARPDPRREDGGEDERDRGEQGGTDARAVGQPDEAADEAAVL